MEVQEPIDRLGQLFDHQVRLQTRLGNFPFFSSDSRREYIKDMTLALTDEIYEALREVDWKKWKKNQSYNEDAFRKELVDAWHFLINLTLASGMDAQLLYDAFLEKNKENHERQERGY